ncbi:MULTISPECIES: thermonuclease family protein [unclassified Rhizobium]|nr:MULTISPECIES: thermonuclease family protein [unclassified Rhizobium]MBO9097194.1 thermonuclease family protein [Rhizobium sp. L58/93]MBO9167432.1 thermonuclease family protein [Rhizobium sp. L245/93]MBO9183391.1 thermonuclease family protein [Rhizobium sp. E27B/91]QXZ83729.1 thermonuclease family protein [Rhizobium sp. K1/93]QXZ88759.1 thermonuclease family protein [Rhizobium sp. K15/93]
MAEPPSSPVEDSAIADRMAPPPMPPSSPTPPTPPVPLAASVPTPLTRPQPPTEKLASAAPLPSDDKDAAASSGKQAPPTQSAALAPQPERPGGDAVGAPQSNADLKPIDLSRPFAERAGILTVGGRSVQLAGIVPTDPARSCTGPNGKEWPCGTLARTALRSFLLGRTITCDVPDPEWKGSITADCRFSRVNIGDWLARNGWAEVAAGSPFAGAADEARKAGRGVYGNDPRKKHQSTLAPEPPKEDPLNPI